MPHVDHEITREALEDSSVVTSGAICRIALAMT